MRYHDAAFTAELEEMNKIKYVFGVHFTAVSSRPDEMNEVSKPCVNPLTQNKLTLNFSHDAGTTIRDTCDRPHK
jgi:hypothetical protein